MPQTPEEILTEHEAAQYLRVSVSYLNASRLRRPRTSGPPWVRLGRAVRYLRTDLDQWLTEQRCTSETR